MRSEFLTGVAEISPDLRGGTTYVSPLGFRSTQNATREQARTHFRRVSDSASLFGSHGMGRK